MKKLTMTIALILIVALAMPAFGQSFSDVPSDHWAYDAINKLVAAGIVEGYPDGEFKGSQNMTRYEMAVMVSRALDRIADAREDLVDKVDEMGEGLTTGQAEDVTAIVKSLMEKNTDKTLSDQEAKEVADIVDALTFELAAELKVLGADVDAVESDLAEVQETVAKLKADMPQDNIEFGMDVTTVAEVANYGENPMETAVLWADGDLLDVDVTGDEGDFPTEKAFYQEYDFTVMGAVSGADFNLALDTINNGFTDYDNAVNTTSGTAFGSTNADENENLDMDSALLEVAYNGANVKLGDLGDYTIYPYFGEEVAGAEGMEMTASYMGYDVKTVAMSEAEGETYADVDIYGAEVSRALEMATITGKVYQTRDSGEEFTLFGGEVTDFAISEAVTMGADLVFVDDAKNDLSDVYMTANAEFVASEALTVTGNLEYAGEEFSSYDVDLDGDLANGHTDFTKVGVSADYVLNKNNTVTGSFDYAMPGDTQTGDEDMTTVGVALANTYGDFTNNASVDYTMNNLYDDGEDKVAVAADTSFAYSEVTTLTAGINYEDADNDDTFTLLSAGVTNEWNETTTLGAELKFKDYEDGYNYTYLAGSVDKELNENITWNTTANYIVGEADFNDDGTFADGEGNTLKTSLSVSF
ncbi:MAG: S-layer homology domain-containing protein [Halanaerobiales bacterium]|nr:S-layer homology domain-containing protein [Halanaerobiales bacterium]